MTTGTRERTDAAAPWGDVSLEPGAMRGFDLGTLRLILRRTANEIWIQTQRAPDFGEPDEGAWERWAVRASDGLAIRPAMPDRLLVVSHEHSYHLPPERDARVYVRIPLFVQVVTTGRHGRQVLAELPSVVLSSTWWGTVAEGELGYWLTTKARSAVSDELFLPHFGMCPLRLVNESDHALPVERFALQVAHLSLFADGSKNWTDEVRVRYEDSPEGSEVRFGEEAPPEAPAAELLASPRVKPIRGFHARTFARIRSISHLDF